MVCMAHHHGNLSHLSTTSLQHQEQLLASNGGSINIWWIDDWVSVTRRLECAKTKHCKWGKSVLILVIEQNGYFLDFDCRRDPFVDTNRTAGLQPVLISGWFSERPRISIQQNVTRSQGDGKVTEIFREHHKEVFLVSLQPAEPRALMGSFRKLVMFQASDSKR